MNLGELRRRILKEAAGRTYKISLPYDSTVAAITTAYSALLEASGQDPRNVPGDKIASVAKWLCSRGKSGLLLYGGYGLGKTTMLNSLRHVFNSLTDCFALHFTAKKFVENYSDNGTVVCSEKTLVMIDELGREFDVHLQYGNATEPIADLICYREDRGLPTILSTNLTEKELRNRYGPYIYDRLFGSYNRIFYDGKSFRGNDNIHRQAV